VKDLQLITEAIALASQRQVMEVPVVLTINSICSSKEPNSSRAVTNAYTPLEKNSMKRSALILSAALIVATSAFAQDPPAQSGPGNKAVNSSGQNNSNAPVAGRNSFTEGQAKSKIEEAGFSNVSGLAKDDNGIWRGKANKGGSSTNVSLDFQGNVNAAK
jgi:hypothetical protein